MPRNRTQSLPTTSLPEEIKIGDNRVNEEEEFEADDEKSKIESKRPSNVAKEEIAQARRLNEKLSSPTTQSSNLSTDNQSQTSLIGSIYSLGGSLWSFIRGIRRKECGPVDTDSNDEMLIEKQQRLRSKSFSLSSHKMSTAAGASADSDESNFTDSSEAPNFSLPEDESPSPVPSIKTKISVEAGRGKIVFEQAAEAEGQGSVTARCNLIGRDFPEDEHVLSSNDISSIQSQIPARWHVYSDWILLYSTRGNGFSLTTLYHQLKPFKGPLILAIKDDSNSIFGAFLNQTIQPRQGHYGNGECFLWHKNHPHAFTKFPSTGKNNYFIISEPDYLAIGCGGGKFGLWLEKELFKGISDPVPTFDNEQLSKNHKFDCIGIEIWGLDLNE